MSTSTNQQLGEQFAKILHGKAKLQPNSCSVSLKRNFNVHIQGRPSGKVLPVGASYESLDQNGYALNLLEIAVLEEEIPHFVRSVAEQGLIVGAIHNHWIFIQPNIMYVHVQSIEPPLQFAEKLSNAFLTLKSQPMQDDN